MKLPNCACLLQESYSIALIQSICYSAFPTPRLDWLSIRKKKKEKSATQT